MILPILNFTNPFITFVALVIFSLIILLARHLKRSFLPAIMLLIFLALIICHSAELMFFGIEDTIDSIAFSIAVDFVFILISFISYLWLDDIEAKDLKKKSIDNSLDWFWSKV